MAAPSAQTLQRLADDTGHQPGTLEKVLRLLDPLQEIAKDQVLSDRLVLKGGTALNLFHLGLDRLSVDIDLNYVGALDRAAMESERPAVDTRTLPTPRFPWIRRSPQARRACRRQTDHKAGRRQTGCCSGAGPWGRTVSGGGRDRHAGPSHLEAVGAHAMRPCGS